MAVVFRPVGAAAVPHRGFAVRLGEQIARTGAGGTTKMFEGFLFRAVRSGQNMIVYALDPEAVWAFLHKDTFSVTGLVFAVRAYNRDLLRPGVPPAIDDPVDTTDVLTQYQPGGGFMTTIDTGALLLVTNRPSTPAVTHATVSLSTMASTSNAVSPSFATDRFQLWTEVFGVAGQPKWYAPGGDTSEFVAYYHRIFDWFFPEDALEVVTADSNARLMTRNPERYSYQIPTFAPQNTGEGLASLDDIEIWYSDPFVGGAYVSQPTGVDIAPPNDDPAWLGIAGTFVTRMRRPPVPDENFYPLAFLGTTRRLMTNNPELELRPALVTEDDVTQRAFHGVSSSGLCYALTEEDKSLPPDGLGSRGDIHLFSHVFCYQGETLWHAVQRQTLRANNTSNVGTLYKGTDNVTFTIGHRITMFEVDGVYGTRRPATTTAADSALVEFVHMGVDDVIRVTGLRDAGWYAFTDYVGTVAQVVNGSLWGQSSVSAADIGNGRIAVIARNYIVPNDAVDATWGLVVVDSTTGEFVEARGEIGVANAFTYLAHLVVITREQYNDETDVTTPAVLMCNLGDTCRLSTDGGVTWHVAFTGFRGYPLYIGNQYHRIGFGHTI